MKNVTRLFTVLFINTIICVGQDIKPAPADKAVVYFVRTASVGMAINFSYYDSARLIGKFKAPKYIRYECKPGVHLFWARSENRDFVEADLEAGKIYFIEALPKMGAMKARVQLVPLNPNDQKKMDKAIKLLTKKSSESFTPEELEIETKNSPEAISSGLEKYREDKAKGTINLKLEKSMYYVIQ